MNCEYCQSPVHIWFQCPKKPDGWKPARLAKKSGGNRAAEPAANPDPPQGSKGLSDDGREVTLQRPVEGTNSSEMTSGTKSPRLGMDEVTGLEAARQVATPMTGKTKAERLGNTCGGGYSVGSEAQKVERRSPKPEDASSIPATSAKFDKKTWQRNYMKTYLRQYRADVKSGKRTPKPRAYGKDEK